MRPRKNKVVTRTGAVTRYLREEILTKRVRQHGVLVWYDPTSAFQNLVDELSIEGLEIIRFQGSYYRLRHEAERIFSRLDRTSLTSDKCLLVYVNASPLDRRTDVLLGLEKAGSRFDWSLAAVAREALKDRVPQGTLDGWLSNETLSLEDLDRLAGSEVPVELSTIALIFATTAATEVAIRYLSEPALESDVEKRGVFSDLRALFSSALGLPDEGITSLDVLRKRLSRHVLITEFLSNLRSGTVVPELARVGTPRNESQVNACCEVARGLRDRWSNRDQYATLARGVENEFNLRSLKLNPESVGEIDTFPFEEETLFRSLEDLAERGELVAAMAHVQNRRASFWLTVDPIRAMQWRTAEEALALCLDANRVFEEVKASQPVLDVLARGYAHGEAGRGRWYEMDRHERRLEWLVSSMEPEFQLENLLRVAREKHYEAAQALAEKFLEAIQAKGFSFSVISQQTDTFARVLRPFLDNGPVAYFQVDGLRYEMAVDLLESLSFAEKAEVFPAIGLPPAIPVIGFAALLPGAEAGISLVERSGALAAEVDGNLLVGPIDRIKLMKKRLGEDNIVDLPLNDLVVKRADTLRKRIVNKKLILVRTPEIERIEIETRALQSRKWLADLLGDLRRAIRRISDLGISQVVVASSHGYLLTPSPSGPVVEPPDGRTIDLRERSWVGKGGGVRPDYVRFRAVELGLGGELEMAFPIGLRLFETKSEPMPFVYGGLSPQEIIVPVATVAVPVSGPAETEDKFELVLAKESITNRLFTVTIRYQKGSLLSGESRRVRVVARSGKQEIGRAATAVHGYDQVSGDILLVASQENHVTIMLTGEARQGSLSVELIDPDTDVTLRKTPEVPYEISI